MLLSVAHAFTHMRTSETHVAIISAFSLMPSNPGEHSIIGTLIGVGVGVSMFLLLVLVIVVVIILVVVVVRRRKAACKQKRDATMADNQYYNNTVVVNQEMEQKETGAGVDYEDLNGYQDVDEDKGKEEGPITDGNDLYVVVDTIINTSSAKTLPDPRLRESVPTASATSVSAVDATVDNSNREGMMTETGDGCTVADNNQYAIPLITEMDEMTGKVEIGDAEKGEQYNDKVGFKYEPNADSEPLQPSEGGFEC